MMTDTIPPPMTPNKPTKESGRSCWVVGCSGCLIVLALLVLAGIFISWQVKRNVLVEPFEPIEMSESEEVSIREKLESLNLLTADGLAPESFEMPENGISLSETEVNYWISQIEPDATNTVRLDFEPGTIDAEMRLGEGEGKRILIRASVSVVQVGDAIDVQLKDVKVGKFSLPGSMMEELKKENILEDSLSDPEIKEQLDTHVKSIEILKDRIIILPK